MQAVQYNEISPDVNTVSIKTVAKPVAVPGMVVVKVHAASTNPIDHIVMKGYVKDIWSLPLPFTMGYDFSGVVDSVDASDCGGFAVGDEVFAVNWGQHSHNDADPSSPVGGAFAEYILIPCAKLSRKPKEVSHQDAAAVALVGTTAYQTLFECLQAKEGSRILVLGGPTSVGTVALQLAKLKGVWTATTTSTRNMNVTVDLLKPDLAVNYNTQKWEELEELKGIDGILDVVGEKQALQKALANGVLKEGGRFVTIANLDVGFDAAAYPPLSFGSYFCLKNDPKVQDELVTYIADGKLKQVIDSTYQFNEADIKTMLAKVESGKAAGKLVINLEN